MFDTDMMSVGGDNLAITLNENGDAYTIKSALNETCLVNITVSRAAPGFVAGKNGTSTFGTDPEKPWGKMQHAFWPRCNAEGTITTPDRDIDFKGRAFFVHALQGMKPHHAGKFSFTPFSYFLLLLLFP